MPLNTAKANLRTMTNEEDDDRPLSREERIEEFGKEKVEHTEWWASEMERVGNVMEQLVGEVSERDDVQLSRRGKEVGRDGEHTLKLRVTVAGEPWEGGSE